MLRGIVEHTKKELMALSHPQKDQGSVAGEGAMWLVSRGWSSVPQHGDQAYDAIVEVRIWNSVWISPFRAGATTPSPGMRVTTVRGPRCGCSAPLCIFSFLSPTSYSRGTLSSTRLTFPLVVWYAVFWHRGDGLALGALRPEAESLPARPEGQMRGCFISGFPVFRVLVRISAPVNCLSTGSTVRAASPLKSNTGTPS